MNDELLLRSAQFEWQPVLPSGLHIAALVTLLLVLVLSMRGYASLSPARRVLLMALRASALTVLAVLLCGPVMVHTDGQQRRVPLVVLIDASRSMKTQDLNGQARTEVIASWLDQRSSELARLAEEYRLRYFLIDLELRAWSGQGQPSASATATDLGKALFGIQAALGGERPGGVLLVSDGADRSTLARAMRSGGADAVASLAAELSFPISTWTVGNAQGPPDLGVKIRVPPFGFVRRPLNLDVTVHNRSLPRPEIEVVLREEGKIVATQVLSGDEGEQSLHFEVKPDRAGFRTYRVEIPQVPGDAVADNNFAEVTVKVIRDRTRVLQVSSRPSWDVKFLRRLLKTDPNIDLVSFFILRNSDRRGPLTRSGDLSLIAFPYEELFSEDLQGFDLVIFQDFWFGSFTQRSADPFLANIANYVRAGGAFLMVGGDSSFGEGDYAETVLDEVMPTRIPATAFVRDEYLAQLTAVGYRHPVTRLEQEVAHNKASWERLSPLVGRNPLGPLREGAVALLTAGPDGPVLAAARNVGSGRTLAFASDQSWRWSMSQSTDAGASGEHASFWRNTVRWLVKDAQQEQLQVLLDRQNYRLGDEVQVQVRVLGDDYAPREGVAVVGSIGPLSGEPWQALSAVTDSGGQVTFRTQAAAEGVMVSRAEVDTTGGMAVHAEARASVSTLRGELEDPRAVPELMAALARGSGGAVLDHDNPDPGRMTRSSSDGILAMQRRVEPLWDRWWWMLLGVLPLAAEWTLRRRLGLR